jgi:phytol kinase
MDWDWRHDLRGAAILGAVFLGLLASAELWRRFGRAPPEWTRKLVHVGGGIACLFFPLLVESPWVVLGMAAVLCGLFALGQRLGFLGSLHAVSRRSRGSEYYPLAVFLVFFVGRDRPWLYASAVLVLTVADALAALIGSRYGSLRYEVEDGSKSLEGSLAFLAAAFLAIHLPLSLLSDLSPSTCALSASLVAVLVTGFEAISLRGTDNLFVPIAVFVVLEKITSKPVAEIAYQNLSLLAICAVVAAAVWRTRSFNVGGSIVFTLFAFAAWSLGSEWWAVPPLLGFGAYMLAWFAAPVASESAFVARVRTTTGALLPPFAVLVAANVSGEYDLLHAPYLAATTLVTAFSLRSRFLRGRTPQGGARPATGAGLGGALAAGVAAWLAVAAVPWWLERPAAAAGALLAVLAASLPLAALDDLRLPIPGLRGFAGDGKRERETAGPSAAASPSAAAGPWSAARFLLSVAAALLVLLFQLLGLSPAWRGA